MTDIYRAIADPIRRRILTILSRKECTQTELVDHFPISQPAVKKHLTILLEEKLIEERREGKYRLYRLKQDNFAVHYKKLQEEIGLILEDKLTKLKNYLEED